MFLLNFWRTYQADEARTGAADFSLGEGTPVLAWADTLSGASAPVVGPDRSVYISTEPYTLLKLNAVTGDTIWEYVSQGDGTEPIPPSLTEDGSRVFFFVMYQTYSTGGIVNCLSSDGDSLWSTVLPEQGAWIGVKGGVSVGSQLYVPDMANPNPRVNALGVSDGQILEHDTIPDTLDLQWVTVSLGNEMIYAGGHRSDNSSLGIFEMYPIGFTDTLLETGTNTDRVAVANPDYHYVYHPSDDGIWFIMPYDTFKVGGNALAAAVVDKPAQVWLFVAFSDSLTALDGQDGSSLEWSIPLNTTSAAIAVDTSLHVILAYNGKVAMYKAEVDTALWELQVADTSAKPKGIALAQWGDTSWIFVSFNDHALYALLIPSMGTNESAPQGTSLVPLGNSVVARGEGTLEVYSASGRLVLREFVSGERRLAANRLGKGVFIVRFGNHSVKLVSE